jgi:type I restriction enzyme S subunit
VWNLTELESLFSFVLGGDWGKAPDFSEEGYLDAFCIRGTEFKHWTRDKGITSVHRKLKASSLENRTLQLNDILIEISGGGPDQPVGRTVLIDEEALQVNSAHPKVCTNFIRLVRPSCSIHGPYLNYYLRSFYLSGEVTKYQGGSNNLRNLKFKEYSKIEVPVAPLNEQIRIANKLDSILAKVDKAQARLNKIPAILKRFRQSVLAAATSGELTKEWREEYSPLKHPEVTGKYNLDWSIIEESNLPESWQWVALGNYAKCNRGKFSIRPRNDPSCFDGDYPFIQIGDLPRQGGYIYSHKQTLNEKGYSVSREFDTGTVVLAIVGATIANTGITTYPVCFPDSLVGISSSTDTTNKYLDYHLRAIKENIRQASYAGGGQPNIKLTMVNPLPLPLPPENEIVAIVDKVESLMARANKVEKQYLDAKARLDRLTQSILAKAFRGELVPQDPNDEPAEQLLERILKERLSQQQKADKPKKTTKKRTIKTKVADKG